MTDQLISMETFNLAREKGFTVHVCRCGGYPDCVCKYLRPTQSLLQKWLREVHKIIVSPFIAWNLITWGYNIFFIALKYAYEETSKRIYRGAYYKSYEEALEAGLIEALKLIS